MKTIHPFRLVLAIAGTIALSILLLVYPSSLYPAPQTGLPDQALLNYAPEWNDRQSINSCGPYSVAAMLRLINGHDIDSEVIARETPWRVRGYTFPFALTALLKQHGIRAHEQRVVGPNNQQLDWIRAQLAVQRPVILLGRAHGVLHYVTVVGYTNDRFHIYDSLAPAGTQPGSTTDANDTSPGNVDWNEDQLLSFWRHGWNGFYAFYALTP